MLKRLRWQLTLLYLFAVLSLIVLLGAGSYSLLQHYFSSTTDLAIQYRMATQFQQYGLSLPPELLQAEQSWSSRYGRSIASGLALQASPSSPTAQPVAQSTEVAARLETTPSPAPTHAVSPTHSLSAIRGGEDESEDEAEGEGSVAPSAGASSGRVPGVKVNVDESEHDQPLNFGGGGNQSGTIATKQAGAAAHTEDHSQEDTYDGELAPVFVLPLNSQGNLIQDPNPVPPPITHDMGASSAALINGSDWRTIRLSDGTRVRLLTYRTSSSNGPAVLQVGRPLTDQDRLLRQFLMGLIALGCLGAVLFGLGSWWLSGRTLSPAQQAWDQQQIFISNASHELRTPLTLMRATTEVLLRGRSTEEQRPMLEDILNETDYMNRLVDDLLLLSRLDTRRLQLNRERIDLGELLVETKRQVEKLSAERGVNLILDECDGVIMGDPARMRQVLLILLDNALRYTPPGGTVHLGSHRQGKLRQILVTDNGSGIPAEHLPHIFERFYQVSRPGAEDNRSNGLGLSIAKGLVEAQGGSIQIQSREGEGTQVLLSFQDI